MPFELPPLPYEMNALEPHLSARTLEFHHGQHHQAYVNHLNALTEHSDYGNQSLEFILKDAGPGGVYNNAAQVWNHTFYWESMSPSGGGEPTGKLLEELRESFGNFPRFQQAFAKAATGHFGSGWAWLCLTDENTLMVTSTNNADNPLTAGLRPLLVCDVWEHAYYLDYQNQRPDYIAAWWNLVDWEKVGKRL